MVCLICNLTIIWHLVLFELWWYNIHTLCTFVHLYIGTFSFVCLLLFFSFCFVLFLFYFLFVFHQNDETNSPIVLLYRTCSCFRKMHPLVDTIKSLETSFVSQSWCAFWQQNDMLLMWSIVKGHQSQNRKEKHIMSRTHRFYVIFKSSLYVILWYAFINKLTL